MINLNRKPGETDKAYYKRLAKTADQRLVRLERLSNEKGFKAVKTWAYATAMKDISRYTETGTRFNIKIDADKIQDAIIDVKRFLEKPTSQKSTIVKFYKKRAETLNRTQKTNLTWEQLADFFETKGNEKLIKTYGSGDTLRVYNSVEGGKITIGNALEGETNDEKIERELKTLKEALEKEGNDRDKELKSIIHVPDKHVKDTLIQMLKDNAIDPEKVFK